MLLCNRDTFFYQKITEDLGEIEKNKKKAFEWKSHDSTGIINRFRAKSKKKPKE